MYRKRILPAALAAFVLTGAAGGFAVAKERGHSDPDEAALATLPVTLQQAIATAEQQSNGRAVSADIRREHGAAQIEVEIVGPQGARTVLVDGQSGQVTASRAGEQDDEDQD